MNRLGPSQLFVKPGNSLYPKFLWSTFLAVKTQFVKSGRHCISKLYYIQVQWSPELTNQANYLLNPNIH